jgi:hypothetical protein
MNDSSGEFKGKIFRYVISDSIIQKAFIYFDDFNGDQIKDCIVYTSPSNSIRVALGLRENMFEQFELIPQEIKIQTPEQLQIADFDNDGINDILFSDRDNSDLFILRGKNNGKFAAMTKYKTLPKESIFRCGDFNGDSVTDIVYTNPAYHTITIIYGKKN